MQGTICSHQGVGGRAAGGRLPNADQALRRCRASGVHGAGCNGIADALPSLHLLLRASQQLPCTGTGSGNQHPPSSVDMETEQVAVAKDIDVRFMHFGWAGLADEAELPLWAVLRRGLPDNRKLTKLCDLTALEDTWLFDSGL